MAEKKAPAKAVTKKVEEPVAVQTEARVSYSTSVKVNLGNYESADTHLSESESWDVTGLPPEAIEELKNERYLALKEKLDKRIVAEYESMKS